VPNLGVVTAGDVAYTIADVPGLIPGAAAGKGLGLEFLRHIERCAVLVHVVDCATEEPGRDPVSDIDAIEAELAQYRSMGSFAADLAQRPRIVALNKVDVPEAHDLAELVRADVAARGWPVFQISVATHSGLEALSYAMAEQVRAARAAAPPLEPTRIVLRPQPTGETTFAVSRDPEDSEGFLVTGSRPERWVRQTDFTNDEAVGYLADRLARIGVEDALAEAGAKAGDPVRIGVVTFDWQPSVDEYVPSRRGEDNRLETKTRVGAAERREAKRARRQPGEYPDDELDD
jgi:GTP-binding protein